MIQLSKYAKEVQPSATLAAGAMVRQLKEQGARIFDFTIGEPDQNTPEHIIAAAERAMHAGHTHYTPAAGLPSLKLEVAKWYSRFHGFSFEPECVVISNGAKHAIHNALVSIVGPGDEVVIPAPYWVSYGDMVSMAGATPVIVPTNAATGFKLTAEQYRAARTPRTRLLMLNSPCNPTGTVYSRAELIALADAVLETDAGILSDEIYEQLCFDGAKPTCVASLRPALADRSVTVSGVSKSCAMTGWRLGWAVAPRNVAKAMGDIQSQETGCPSSISQHAAIAALTGPQECVAAMRAEYAARREMVCKGIAQIPGLSLRPPDGAFYAFIDVSKHLGRTIAGRPIRDSAAFAAAALADAHVSVVPGSAFGCEGYIRMSFASARSELAGGIDALGAWLASG